MVDPEYILNGLTELYRNHKGVVYQNDHDNTFLLEFSGKQCVFKVQGFINFKKTIDKIDLDDLFLNESAADLQIIHHKNSGQLFLVTLCELVALRDLLAGSRAMLELNSIICSRLAPQIL